MEAEAPNDHKICRHVTQLLDGREVLDFLSWPGPCALSNLLSNLRFQMKICHPVLSNRFLYSYSKCGLGISSIDPPGGMLDPAPIHGIRICALTLFSEDSYANWNVWRAKFSGETLKFNWWVCHLRIYGIVKRYIMRMFSSQLTRLLIILWHVSWQKFSAINN